MSYASEWIASAIDTLSLHEHVRRLTGSDRADVLHRVTATFLARQRSCFWWENLSLQSVVRSATRGFELLPQLAPDRTCWFVTDLTSHEVELGVYEVRPKIASILIGECPCFEYALVDRDLSWIIIENHHDQLIATGEAGLRLGALM